MQQSFQDVCIVGLPELPITLCTKGLVDLGNPFNEAMTSWEIP